MAGVGGTVIFIIIKVIGKKTKRLHIDHEHAGINEVIDLRLAELFPHFFQVSPGYSVKKVFTNTDLVKVFFFLADRRKISTHHVSNIADKITRHYGIKIYHTNSFFIFVKKYVVDLCVVMSYSQFKVLIG